MKQAKKYIITIAALLLSVATWAQGKFDYIYQLNGASSTAEAAGTINGEISGNGTATLTLTPSQGNYINATYITVVKTLSGSNAQTRIGTSENIKITANDANADPSATTTYTFAVEDANYDYEITANFQSRTSISSATVILATTSYTYDGQEHKPAVSSVKLGSATLDTNDYTVSYADDCTNVGSITVTIAGARTYTGTTTATYSITNATMTVTATGYNGTYDGKAHGITVSAPEGAIVKYGTKKGTYDLDASPTYTDAGSYMVHYQVERTNYTTIADSAKVEITKATPSITFDKESYSAIYGETFNAPTPSTNPEGLTVTVTSSSNTQVATIANGIITIVGTGETTITVSFAGNNNYEAATATYILNVAPGTTTGVTATGYTGTYDGEAHGIIVTAPENATIKYGTKKGTYNLNESPTFTDAGTYWAHYQVERTNYTTIADSAKVEITKATPSISFDKESYSATYGETFNAPTPTTNPEGLTITATSSSNTQVATVTDGIISIIGVGETTITVSFAGNINYEAATATYILNVAPGTTTGVTATGYTGTYDGQPHGITVVAPEGATIKYGTKKGTYDLDASPTYTDAGAYMVHYQVERTNYTTIADSAKVEITKATPSITFDKESYSAIYGETFNAPTPSTNPEGLTVTVTSSSNTQVATIANGIITIVGTGETTITVSFAGNNNYEAATATYILNVTPGATTGVTATGYTGTYDGQPHGITVVAPEGATIKYGTKKGTYDLNESPTFTDAGTYMVHYQVTKPNYTTIADSAKVEITKATPSITFDKESYSAIYGETFNAPTPSTNPEGLTVTVTGSSNTQVATIANGIITIVGTGETTITVSFAGNINYEAATATYILNVIPGATTGVTATGYTGTYDGEAHGIIVTAPEGSTIKYGTKKGTYDLDASPTYTDAGTYWAHYQVERTNYTTIADSAKVEITKATPSITFDKESYSAIYGETFNAPTPSTNPEGLTVTVTSSSNTQVATIANGIITIVGTGETTITVSFAGNNNYEAATATYILNVAAGTTTGVTATGYTGTYDGQPHGITVVAPEGATIKYGTKKGTYDLNESPTFTDAGAYMVHYQVERTNYTTIADSATVEISKAPGELAYSAATASAELNSDGWTAPSLSNPHGLDITYSSSNTAVATVSTTGAVTLIGIGQTTIKAASANNKNFSDSEAQYILTVSRGKAKSYGVKIGDTEVNEDNYTDIFGDDGTDDGDHKRVAPSMLFNPEDNTLLIISSNEDLTIESTLPELKIHLSQNNKLKKIVFNNQGNSANTGKVLFTCDSNFPGKLLIENTEGESAIYGFASVSYEFGLQVISPEDATYKDGKMLNGNGAVVSTLSIGVVLNPLTGNEPEELNPDDFTVTYPDGTTATIDLTNNAINNILYTLNKDTEGQGYDPDYNDIGIVTTMTDEAVTQVANDVANNTLLVGSDAYAKRFIGLTFIVQGGEGTIKIEQEVEDGYEFHLKIGNDDAEKVADFITTHQYAEIPYQLDDATLCWLYLVKKPGASTRMRSTRVNKRSKLTGTIKQINIKTKSVASTNSAVKASGGTITVAANNAITGIEDIQVTKQSQNIHHNKWYTLDGRQIDKPSRKGLYIKNKKKVVIK